MDIVSIKAKTGELVHGVMIDAKHLVTADGDVWSYWGGWHKLKPSSNRGYYVVNINRKPRSVHRLVATAYIDNPEHKPQVNHIDGNKHNNRVDNLEWCTGEENIAHAWRTGIMTMDKARRWGHVGGIGNRKLSMAQAEEIRADKKHLLKEIAATYGVSVPTVCQIRLHQRYN